MSPTPQRKIANREVDSSMLLGERAYLTLRQLLITGEIRAGEFLSISELSERIELPIAPIRDAIKKAEAMGLLQVLPKRGIVVLSGTPKLIHDCFRLRAIFDQEGARRLARTKTGRELHNLRARHVSVLNAARASVSAQLQREALAIDWELHAHLSAALQNDSISVIYEQNRDKMAILQSSRAFLPDRLIPAMKEHLAIIDAIIDGDEPMAAELVGVHLEQSLRWWGILAKE